MNCNRCGNEGEFRSGRKVCRMCESVQRSENRQRNATRELAYQKAWRQKNKDKVWLYRKVEGANKRAEDKISYKEVAALFGSNPVCGWCGTTVKRRLQLDHVIPINRKGKNVISNCGILCKSCNASKGDKLPDEMAKKLQDKNPWITNNDSNGVTITTNYSTTTGTILIPVNGLTIYASP